MTPLARLARPEEIASAAFFLASDLSSYVADIDLPVDGSLTAVQLETTGCRNRQTMNPP